jgi:uncharacterized protein YacL
MILQLIILGALGWILVLFFLFNLWNKDEKKEDFKVVHNSALFDGRVAKLFKHGILEGTPVVSQGDVDFIKQKVKSGEDVEAGRDALSVINELSAKILDGDFMEVCMRLKSPVIIANEFKNEIELKGLKCIYIKSLDSIGRGKIFVGDKIHVKDLRYSYNKASGILDDGTKVEIDGKLPEEKSLSLDCVVKAIIEGDTFRKIWARCEE